MSDYRKEANRIQLQLVRIMAHAQTWHDMEQIADAMFHVELRAEAMIRAQKSGEGCTSVGGVLTSPVAFEVQRGNSGGN